LEEAEGKLALVRNADSGGNTGAGIAKLPMDEPAITFHNLLPDTTQRWDDRHVIEENDAANLESRENVGEVRCDAAYRLCAIDRHHVEVQLWMLGEERGNGGAAIAGDQRYRATMSDSGQLASNEVRTRHFDSTVLWIPEVEAVDGDFRTD
jgi:hypothetical protein